MTSIEPLHNDLELKVLSLLTDDYFSLYEVSWYINSSCGYGNEESAIVAMKTIKTMLEKYMVALFNQHLGNATVEPITNAQSDRLFIEIDHYISQDPSKEHIVVTATEFGEQYYQEHYRHHD